MEGCVYVDTSVRVRVGIASVLVHALLHPNLCARGRQSALGYGFQANEAARPPETLLLES